MYAQFFGLRQAPFSIAPDPRYLFMSERHREALAHLLYGVRGGGGFVLLSGEIGAGKTTVCRCFLEQVPPDCDVAFIFNPKLSVVELLQTICDEFRVARPAPGAAAPTVKDYLDPLNARLLEAHAAGRSSVLIIDEAQNLSADVLEQLRLLTNLETSERKLLQIVLIGQPELRTMLAAPELEQLAQRVIARYHLEPLSAAETQRYIAHRLAVAGLTRALPFDAPALQRIQQITRGVPRRINLLCDRALLGAYATGRPVVDRGIVEKAAAEVFGPSGAPADRAPVATRGGALALGAGGGLLAGALLVALWQGLAPRAVPAGALHAAPATAATTAAAGTAAATPAVPGPQSAVGADRPASVPPGRVSDAAPSGGTPAAAATGSLPASAAPASAGPADLATAFGPPLRDEASGWRQLAPLWSLGPLGPQEGDPCQAAQRAQLSCFRTRGSLALLRQLDRPALLTLRDEHDRPAYVLLTALGDDRATLRVGAVVRTVPQATLALLWRGEFGTFWRTPPGYVALLDTGASGPAVDWLDQALARARHEPPPASAPGSPRVVDAALKSRVYAFQLTQGLSPDGVAGPATLMQLNRFNEVAEPHLAEPHLAETHAAETHAAEPRPGPARPSESPPTGVRPSGAARK